MRIVSVVHPSVVSQRVAAFALMSAVMAGCQIVQVETPDPAAVPAGSLVPRGPDATGPILELGSGQVPGTEDVPGLGWRYAIYPSDDGWCTQLEMREVASTGCGDLLPREGRAFGAVGEHASDPGSARAVDGIVTEDIVTVWLIEADSGRRVPAILMPLDEADLDGSAFLGFVPDGMDVTHLQALRMSGEIVETYELP